MTRRRMADLVPPARLLEGQLVEAGLAGFEREYEFMAGRKFRSDLAYVAARLLVEVDGATWVSGTGHTSGRGKTRDCEKDAEAAILGWHVIRVTTDMVESGAALSYIRRFLAAHIPATGKE